MTAVQLVKNSHGFGQNGGRAQRKIDHLPRVLEELVPPRPELPDVVRFE